MEDARGLVTAYILGVPIPYPFHKKKSQNLNSIKSTWITIYKLVTISHTHTHTSY